MIHADPWIGSLGTMEIELQLNPLSNGNKDKICNHSSHVPNPYCTALSGRVKQ